MQDFIVSKHRLKPEETSYRNELFLDKKLNEEIISLMVTSHN